MVPKIVLDTNVIISVFGWKGSPHQILLRCIAGDFRLHFSLALLKETTRVLGYAKFGFTRSQIDEFVSMVVETADMVDPDFILDIVTEDPSDNRVVECAAVAGCAYVVTGDKHLLELSSIDEIQILSPDRFLALFPLESR